MGNSTGSMMYLVVIFLALYLVGVGIYQGIRLLKKWREKKRDRRFNDGK